MSNSKQNDYKDLAAGFSRHNAVRYVIQRAIATLAGFPSLLIEVFTRGKFGERYFSLMEAFYTVFVLWFITIGDNYGIGRGLLKLDGRVVRGLSVSNILILLFGLAVLIMAVIHKRECLKKGRTIDFTRFSHSEGRPLAYFKALVESLPGFILNRFPPIEHNYKRYYEPFAGIVLGAALLIFPWTRVLGLVLLVGGFFYYQRSRIQYLWGRNTILDFIDEKIVAEEMETLFRQDKPSTETRGVMVSAPLPTDPDIRAELYKAMTNTDHTGLEEGDNSVGNG